MLGARGGMAPKRKASASVVAKAAPKRAARGKAKAKAGPQAKAKASAKPAAVVSPKAEAKRRQLVRRDTEEQTQRFIERKLSHIPENIFKNVVNEEGMKVEQFIALYFVVTQCHNCVETCSSTLFFNRVGQS